MPLEGLTHVVNAVYLTSLFRPCSQGGTRFGSKPETWNNKIPQVELRTVRDQQVGMLSLWELKMIFGVWRGIGGPRWTILRFKSRSWAGMEVFGPRGAVGVTHWACWTKIPAEMTQRCQTHGSQNCLLTVRGMKMNLQVMYTETARHGQTQPFGRICAQTFVKSWRWRLDLWPHQTLSLLVWNWPKVIAFLAVWQFGRWPSAVFFAQETQSDTQVKPRLASLEKEVTWSNFSSHQLRCGHDKKLRLVKRAVACFQCPPAVWLVRPGWAVMTLDLVLAYGVCVNKNESKI